ncbi:TetR/AcrR family transcriptional regulator [Trebonia kvetii]|uniref:TetR/AcrR family transcriptional regulator n=1 Tax=Trebonia kvetii TaxID=2480626 RepID=A0A6P2BSP8_9ACTN|nr:TetR/AcrR family transcriptional regulator [Trebonia kvetii]TVZ02129.1 TetR/AcrR family transcriptional regulator [Trebonia kvetii]
MTRGSGGIKRSGQRGQPGIIREPAQQGISRRDVILTQAAALFADQGVTATTVRQIAEAAGVLSGSLYHHFQSKEEIAQEVVITYLDDLRGRYRALGQRDLDPLGRLRSLVLVSLEAVAEYPYAVAIYQNEAAVLRSIPRRAHITAVAAEIDQFWTSVITAGVDSGHIRSDVGPRLLRRLLRDAVWVSPRWYRPSPACPPAMLADDLLRVFLEGCSARDPRRLTSRVADG